MTYDQVSKFSLRIRRACFMCSQHCLRPWAQLILVLCYGLIWRMLDFHCYLNIKRPHANARQAE